MGVGRRKEWKGEESSVEGSPLGFAPATSPLLSILSLTSSVSSSCAMILSSMRAASLGASQMREPSRAAQ